MLNDRTYHPPGRCRRLFRLVLPALVLLQAAHVSAGDWPQFRYDSGRTAASPHELPSDLELRWVRDLPTARPAFPGDIRLSFDASYEPVVVGKTMFVASMVTDSVTALDTETGNERWRFFAEGPVRFAPVVAKGKVYAVSDDGYLYCLDAEDGSLCWKFRGLPAGRKDRKVIAHERLISLRPARGGPVLADGVVYFAAGLCPTEGTFVHAVDAESGKAVWSNVEVGNIPKSNWDHGVGFTAGLTPQGYLAIVGGRLVVPCGAQLPAFLDLKTGKLQTYTMGWGGRVGLPKGCWFVAGVGKYLSHAGDLYDITRPSEEGRKGGKPGGKSYQHLLYPGGWTRLVIERTNQRELDRLNEPVMTADVMYESGRSIVARDLKAYSFRKRTKNRPPLLRPDDQVPDLYGGVFERLWELPSDLRVHIKAGKRLYVGGPGVIAAIDVSGQQPKVVRRISIEGEPRRMLAADGKLFVVTDQGRICALAGAQPGGAVTTHKPSKAPASAADAWTKKADAILRATGVRDGYALLLGMDGGRLIEELVRQSNLHVIAVDGDPAKVAAVRDRLHAMGLYGTRASVVVGDPLSYPFSPYMASLVVSETSGRPDQAGERAWVRSVFHVLRPYGGVAVASGSLADRGRLEKILQGQALGGAGVREVDGLVMLARPGSLPGAADWSHAQANAASMGASQDEFIRSPMAVLWFNAAQRWHKFPGQDMVRVANGRVVLLDEGFLQAIDVFTGRTLWRIDSPVAATGHLDPNAWGALRYKRHRQWGPPPSIARTAQLVAVEDAIYLSNGTSCRVLDPATGRQTGRIDLPGDLKGPWANLRVQGDCLVGSSGANVLCTDRRSGKLLWRVGTNRAALSLAVGKDKVFCSELANPRRGEVKAGNDSLFALSLVTGRRLWQGAGGAPLRYSPSLDIVVTPARFYRGGNGEPLPWKPKSPNGNLVFQAKGLPKSGIPGFIAGSKLITGNESCLVLHELPSGNPIGKRLEWNRRGCTSSRASTYLLTTRFCGNSAWIDLSNREITPLLGVRPACGSNNNLIPANGVLIAPNLTGGCTCNYLPVSVACVPAAVVRRNDAE